MILSERKQHRNKVRFLAAILLGLFVILLLPGGLALAQPASLEPEGGARTQIKDLQAQADAIQQEIDSLNRELEVVVERHNAIRVELDQLTLDLADSRSRLDTMRSEQEAQEKIISDRLEAVYKAGDINILSLLLNSSSMNDFYEQARYIAKISEQDAKLEMQFKKRADEVSDLTDEIDQKRSRQMRLERELGEQRELVETRIAERQNKLDQVDAHVRQILEQEAERQRAEQARLAAEHQALLSELQISDEVQSQVVQTALRYLGVPYVWGGESPSGFDCSGLTKYVFRQHGVDLPHYAASQFLLGMPVAIDQLQPGDLLFWGPGHPHHVAMFIGRGKYIEAPNFGEVVKISVLEIDGDYAGARRYPLKGRTL